MLTKTSKEKVTKARFSRRGAQNKVPKAQFPSNARFPSAKLSRQGFPKEFSMQGS